MPLNVFKLDRAEREEIGKMIRRLSRPERVAWVAWCCQRVSRGDRQCVLTMSDGPATERWTWEHFKALCILWQLDVAAARAELELRVQGAGMPLLFRAMG